MRIDFNWDTAKAAANLAKHGVTFEDAMTVLSDPLARSMPDIENLTAEERWIMLG